MSAGRGLFLGPQAAGWSLGLRMSSLTVSGVMAQNSAASVSCLFLARYIKVDRGASEEKYRRHRVNRLRKQAAEFGFEIVDLKEAA